MEENTELNKNTTLQIECYWNSLPNYTIEIYHDNGKLIETTVCKTKKTTIILSIQSKTDAYILLSPISGECRENKVFLTLYPHKNHVIHYFLNKKINNQVDIFYKDYTLAIGIQEMIMKIS